MFKNLLIRLQIAGKLEDFSTFLMIDLYLLLLLFLTQFDWGIIILQWSLAISAILLTASLVVVAVMT
jgi:hypothetical protein